MLTRNIYESIIENKSEFLDFSIKYWIQVKSVWVKNGSRKLTHLSTFGEYGRSTTFSEEHSSEMDARNFFPGDEVKATAFAWYCGADLINSTKYFKLDDLKHWQYNAFRISEPGVEKDFDGYKNFMSDEGVDTSTIHLAEAFSGKFSSRYASRFFNVVDTINNDMRIDFITAVLPDGFNKYVSKISKVKNSFSSSIDNKMKFIIWKKKMNNSPMTQSHFKNSVRVDFGAFSSMAWNEYRNIDGLVDKKYFIREIKTYSFKDVSNLNQDFVKIKLEWLGNNYFHQNQEGLIIKQIVDLIENIKFDDDVNREDFLNWFFISKSFAKIPFKVKDGAFFTGDNFKTHLFNLYLK